MAHAANINMADSSSDEENAVAAFLSVINEKETASSTKRLGTMLDNEKVISKIVTVECSWFDPYAVNSMVLWPCTYANCRPNYCAFFRYN